MVKAGSLVYAIFICILVGIFCYSLLLMSGYSKLHQTMLFSYSELISNNESAQQYFLGIVDNIDENELVTDLFEDGIVSSGIVKSWGNYKILLTQSVFKNDTIRTVFMIGKKVKNDNLALYLADENKPLFMVGKAKITGKAFLPKNGIKQGYITSNGYQDSKFLIGDKSDSELVLPKIITPDFVYAKKENVTVLESNDTLSIHNSFFNPTLIVKSKGVTLDRKKLYGHIVLKSNDSIYIKNTNILEDIIIEAPKVVFEKGFRGNVQVIAKEIVELEDDVFLKYPSSILINDGVEENKKIIINKGSKVIGGVVMNTVSSKEVFNQMITIDETAEVVGDVYCTGSLQLKGNVTGTVYTNSFYLKTEASSYDNYIMDGTIDRKNLPVNFIRMPLFKNKEEQFEAYVIIKSI